MDREAIIKLAREAGLEGFFAPNWDYGQKIERFAALVAEHEREQCALIAAHILKMPQNDVSTLIRVRGMRHE